MRKTGTKALMVVFAFAALSSTARAEARWDGLLNDGNNFNWFAFQQEQRDENSLEARGVQTDFNEAPTFEPEFQVETLRDRLDRPFTTGFSRDR
ncbi:MAG: hypothetical protein AAF231_14200 [Pseudomonadota bacterium]